MAAAFGMGAAVLAGASVARAYGSVRGWVTAAAVLASPAYLTATISQFADVPLAFYMLATLVAFDRAISSDRAVWWMAAAGCAGCAAWTKNEGRVFLILSMAAMAFQAWRMAAPAAGRRIAALVLGVLPGIAALASFRMLLPAPHNLFTDLSIGHVMHDAGSGARWRAIAESLGRQIAFGGSTTIGNVPVVAAFTAALGRARPCPPAAVCGALVLVLMLLAYAVTYLLSPFDLAWHLRTSADRVVVQLVPAAIWALMMSGRRRPGVTAE
jgi:asparagine N-glycosylation enzyme membrane subunit Stt3